MTGNPILTDTPLHLGSKIVITGINGYIASHVADQLLRSGYVVRGLARDEKKIRQIRDVLLQRNAGVVFEGLSMPHYKDERLLREAFEGAISFVAIRIILTLS